jgi:hypothetical protein
MDRPPPSSDGLPPVTSKESIMPRPKPHKTPGRPNVLGDGAQYLTVKIRRDQMKAINRLAGPAPGGRPKTMRTLLDIGIKVARQRVARC